MSRLFQDLLESSSTPLIIVDPENLDVIEANDAALEFFHVKSLGKAYLDVLTGNDREEIQRWIQRATEDISVTFPLSSDVYPIRDMKIVSSGSSSYHKSLIMVTIRDVTENFKLEKSLREAKEELEHYFDASLDLLCIATTSGLLIKTNREWERVLGYSEKELNGNVFMSFIHPDDLERTTEAMEILRSGKDVLSFENRYRCKDGSFRYIDWRATPEGPLVYAVARDVTDKKKVEEALLETNKRLIEASERAEASRRIKSEFLANMSHELRTPMNGVVGMVTVLLDTALSGEQMEYAKAIQSSSETLLRLIDDILDISKMEAGMLRLEEIEFDLADLMDQVLDILAFKSYGKGVELSCFLDPHTPTKLKGDPGRLRQILINLGGNAIKFTDKGEVHIEVSCEEDNQQTIVLRFSVSDTGIGVSQDDHLDIFDKFTQADRSISSRFGGTGLGLSISKQLITAMRGQIGFRSPFKHQGAGGPGSEFWFSLPILKQQTQNRAEPYLTGKKALVMDGNRAAGNSLKKTLTSYGASVEITGDGLSGFKTMKRAQERDDPFDFVVIDENMEDIGGAALIKMIKKDDRFTGTSIIAMKPIGSDRHGDISDPYLIKPVRTPKLNQAILSALSHAPNSSSTIKQQKPIPSPVFNSKILVAEDSKINQRVITALLKKIGMKVSVVDDGKETLDALEKDRYDLVLMDMNMPIMGGIEATQNIRAYPPGDKNYQIPVIALTASSLEEDRQKCLQSGMDDYISKPITPTSLKNVLAKWLPQRR